jgi:hypothetical protein
MLPTQPTPLTRPKVLPLHIQTSSKKKENFFISEYQLNSVSAGNEKHHFFLISSKIYNPRKNESFSYPFLPRSAPKFSDLTK